MFIYIVIYIDTGNCIHKYIYNLDNWENRAGNFIKRSPRIINLGLKQFRSMPKKNILQANNVRV